jgi:fatty acid synthase subunit beta
MSTEALAEVTFLRGMTMQQAVPRDPITGKSDYAMISIDPTRVGPHLSEDRLIAIVKLIYEKSRFDIQVVNFNIKGSQYVAAGKIPALVILGQTLNFLTSEESMNPVNVEKVILDQIKEVNYQQSRSSTLSLERTKCTIPLPGIDVPFHSNVLADKVADFRKLLEEKISEVISFV